MKNVAFIYEEKGEYAPRDGYEFVKRDNVAAIIKYKDEYLLLKFNEVNYSKSLVTGGIEKDENMIEATKREVIEETGYLDIDSITPIDCVNISKFFVEHKGQNLQAAAAKFQQDLQNNKYTQQQAEAVNAGLQRQQADLQALQQRLSNEFQSETDKFNTALRDSLQHFLAKYNKDKRYALILSKAGDNILYADKVYDITEDVIAGLNKAYKSTAAAKEKKEEKK